MCLLSNAVPIIALNVKMCWYKKYINVRLSWLLLSRTHKRRNPVIGKPSKTLIESFVIHDIYNIKQVFHVRLSATLAVHLNPQRKKPLFYSRHEKPPKPSKILQSVVASWPLPKPFLCHPSLYPSARSYDCCIISCSRVKQARASQSRIDGSKRHEGGGNRMRLWRDDGEKKRKRGRVETEESAGREMFFRQASPGRSVGGASHTRHLCGNKMGKGWKGKGRPPSLRRACAIFIARTTPAC